MNIRDALFTLVAAFALTHSMPAAVNGLDTWVPRGTANQVVYGNGVFVCFDNSSGRSRVSSDGTNWSTWLFPASSPGTLTFAGDRFFARGSYGTESILFSSKNGQIWTVEGRGMNVNTVAWNGLHYLALGSEVWTNAGTRWSISSFWTPYFQSVVSAPYEQTVVAASYDGLWASEGIGWRLVLDAPVARSIQLASRYLVVNPATTTPQTNSVFLADNARYWQTGTANISWSNCMVSSSLGLTFLIDPVWTRSETGPYGPISTNYWNASNIFVTVDGIYWERHRFITNEVAVSAYASPDFQVAYNNGTVVAVWCGQLYQSGFMDGYRMPPPVITMNSSNRLTITGPVGRQYVIEKAAGGGGAAFNPVYSYRHETLSYTWEDPHSTNAAFYRCAAQR